MKTHYILTAALLAIFCQCTNAPSEALIPVEAEEKPINPYERLPATIFHPSLRNAAIDSNITDFNLTVLHGEHEKRIIFTTSLNQDTLELSEKNIKEILDKSMSGRSLVRINADRDLEYSVIKYLNFILRKNHQLKIAYRNNNGNYLLKMQPPFSHNINGFYPVKEKLKGQFISTESIKILSAYGLKEIENSNYVINSDDIVRFRSGDFLEVNGSVDFDKNLVDSLLTSLYSDKNYTRKFILINPDPLKSYEQFLNYYNYCREYVFHLRDNLAQENHGKPYSNCSKAEQQKVRRQIPLILYIKEI